MNLLGVVFLLLAVGWGVNPSNAAGPLLGCSVSIVGAGPGGLYTAWRLASTNAVSPRSICVFEKSDRLGGRVFTVPQYDEIPELAGVHLDAGAARFNPIGEYLTSQLIQQLKVPIHCFPYSQDCSAESFLYLRGKYIPSHLSNNSDNWPYNVYPSEKWGAGQANANRPSPEQLIFAVFPFLMSYIPNLVSTDPAVKWKAVEDALKQAKNYPVYGTTKAHQTNARVAFETLFTSELFQAAMDADYASASWTYGFNLHWALHQVLVQIASTGYPYFSPVNGYGQWVEALAQKFVGLGGRIFYNSELTNIEPAGFLGLTPPALTFSDGARVLTSTVVLNLPPHSIKQIGGITPYRKPSSANALRAFNLPVNVHCSKLFVFYEDAWWVNKLGVVSASLTTTEFIRAVFYDNATVTYNPATKKWQGWIGTYAYGDDIAGYFRAASTDQSEVLSILQNDEIGGKLLYNVHASLLRIHAELLREAGVAPNSISPPTKGVLANWNTNNLGGFHSMQPSPLDPSAILQSFQTPTDGFVHVVNEAFSVRNGWAEGSLIMAEKFLRNRFSLPRPSWIHPSFYAAFVSQNL